MIRTSRLATTNSDLKSAYLVVAKHIIRCFFTKYNNAATNTHCYKRTNSLSLKKVQK